LVQHGSLTLERWSSFPFDRQVLMIGNEMHRCGKLFEPDDRERLRHGYERVLRLTDLTSACRPRRAMLRELRRWRELIAALYAAPQPDLGDHRAAFRALLLLTPASAAQLPWVLGEPRAPET
jgi:hypothetical protein